MKLLNILTLCLSIFLFACAPKSLDDHQYEQWRNSNLQTEGVGTTTNTRERRVEQIDPAIIHIAKTQGDYMEVIARQFRQDLLSTGAQVKHDGPKVYVYIPVQSIFGSNLVTIKPSVEPALKAIVQNLKTHPETMVRVIGHSDNSLSVVRSKALSLRQATAFANYLRSQGIANERLLAEGHGSEDPIANNKTPEGRAKNCYIEMIVYNLQ